MPSELQRVAQQLLDALNQIERIVPYLHERAQKYREAAGRVGSTSNNPSARMAAMQLDEAARRCEEAAHFLTQARQPGIQWVQQMVSGIRTTEPSGGSTSERPLGPGGSTPPADRRRDEQEEEPGADKRDKAAGAGDDGSPEEEQPFPRLTHKDAWRLFQKLPDRTKSGISRPKTRGKWIDLDGAEQDIVSGEDDESARIREFLRERNIGPETGEIMSPSHVETKFGMFMRRNGLTHESIVINNIPCEGEWSCGELLRDILPPGATLTIFGPAGFKRTYPLPPSE
ncbi:MULTISPECIES: DddA-like double-stranded DNA deaminase toxin [unclassified Kribbella]|uniref:DddA-like double-stranded DNA deaminase toxin n=1 Tax=unclassified Kribbella TaxID=2644121 RepID=UPI003076F6C6